MGGPLLTDVHACTTFFASISFHHGSPELPSGWIWVYAVYWNYTKLLTKTLFAQNQAYYCWYGPLTKLDFLNVGTNLLVLLPTSLIVPFPLVLYPITGNARLSHLFLSSARLSVFLSKIDKQRYVRYSCCLRSHPTLPYYAKWSRHNPILISP